MSVETVWWTVGATGMFVGVYSGYGTAVCIGACAGILIGMLMV